MASEHMKREVILLLVFTLFLISLSNIHAADELAQVESAYTCLDSRINATGCSSLKFEEKVFSYLASGDCGNELSLENLSNECWPKSGCTLKSTAQAILALNSNANTTKAENWLLRQTSSPTNIEWFLEIEVPTGATSCRISYSGATYTVTLGEDKKISSNAGNSLVLAQNGYWLKISSTLYNRDIEVSCDKQFLTTLLFMKSGSSTIHVSDRVHNSGASGTTIERVDSLCFAQAGKCNYEGSLWASLVLASLGRSEEVSRFMPYLITMKDDPFNLIYIPESFLYYLTGKFQIDLLMKQRASAYWEESGNKYYDTAIALLPFAYENIPQKSNSKSWLLSVQDRSGCWNNGNIRDTAFLLYSIWPKDPISPVGDCDYYYDCPDIDCKTKSCVNGKCVYESDGSCVQAECTKDSQCNDYDYTSDKFCGSNNKVYREKYDYSCNLAKEMCEAEITEEVVETCSSSETCDSGECISGDCSFLNWCDSGYKCVDGTCVKIEGVCDDDSDCLNYEYYGDPYCKDESTVYQTYYTYYCNVNKGECIPRSETDSELETCSVSEECYEGSCLLMECSDSNPCESGYDCYEGSCIPEGVCHTVADCPEKECHDVSCDSGTCFYTYVCEEECDEDADCSYWNSEGEEYCDGENDNDVYVEVYNYTCQNKICVLNTSEKLIEECNDSTEECEYGICYDKSTDGCNYDDDCEGDQVCNAYGECVDENLCSSDFDCYPHEYCDYSGVCSPMSCIDDYDCNGGKCSENGYCEASDNDCQGAGYYCTSQANCEGNIMQEYSCTQDIFKCCDTEPPLMTCEEWDGEICSEEQACLGGEEVQVSDSLDYGEACCVGGTCGEGGSTEDTYCISEGGECRDTDFCEDGEYEEDYICDYDGQICCIEDTTDKPKRGWILIVILLVLIILAVVGIVFRDKLRTEWIKLKDKLSGKKPKKKFDMPMTMQPNPQGRILPRRILPPGQQPSGPPQQTRFPMRTMGQPISGQSPAQPTQVAKTTLPGQTKPATIDPNATTKPSTPQSSAPKKPEVKPKNGELDDVLKKLKEMGSK